MANESGSAPGRKPTVTPVPLQRSLRERASSHRGGKPTVAGLGVDLATLDWQRSGTGPGSFEVAFVAGQTRGQDTASRDGDTAPARAAEWVLLRVADDRACRVLIYDRNEWHCFLDGVVHDEFEWRQGLARRIAA